MKCPVCEMLRYQDLACEAEKRFKVRYFLRKSEKWRQKVADMTHNQIVNPNNFCAHGYEFHLRPHQQMALDIWQEEVRLRFQLLEFNQEEIKKKRKILAALSFEYAEALIYHGLNSPEANVSRRCLEAMKNQIAARQREVTRLARK